MHTKTTLIKAFLKKYQQSVILTFILGLIANMLTIVLPIIVAASYGLLFNIQSTRAKMLGILPEVVQTSFPAYLAFFASLLLIKGLIDFAHRYSIGHLGEKLVKDLREAIFGHQLKMKMSIYDAKGTGKYLLRYSGDLVSIQNYLTRGIIRFVSDVLLLSLAFAFLFWLSFILGTFVMLAFALTLFGLYFLNKKLYQLSISRRNKKSGLLAFVNTRLSAILSLQTFNKEVPEKKRYEKRSQQIYEVGRSYQLVLAGINAIIPVATYGLLGLVLAAAYFHQHLNMHHLESETFLAVIFLILSLLPVFRRILRVESTWKKGAISFTKLAKLLNLETTQFHRKANFQYKMGKIEFQNLTFSYPDKNPVFDQFSLVILPQKGNFYTLNTKTGQGKTTLIKLLTGIYYPDKGALLIDGQSTKAVNPKSLRKQIAVVADDWRLYGKNVFEAVSYSISRSRKARVKELLNEFQSAIPSEQRLKLSDSIGDFGSCLSSVQIKMLLCMRALLTRKPILIMENLSEGLDAATEKQFIHVLKKYHKKGFILLLNSAKGKEQKVAIFRNTTEVINFSKSAI